MGANFVFFFKGKLVVATSVADMKIIFVCNGIKIYIIELVFHCVKIYTKKKKRKKYPWQDIILRRALRSVKMGEKIVSLER